MTIAMIAAMARNRVIGIDNGMPWRLPAEMAHFRRSTAGKTVVMGRKTFESLSGPLKNRRNVILTRSLDYKPDGCEVAHSVEEVLTQYGSIDGQELVIMGGAEIYALFMPYADKLWLTEVEAEVAGDAHFPTFQMNEWTVQDREHFSKDEKNAYDFTIVTYVRNAR
ncbi:dihydrofolate reductase [Paenibacillus sp. CF384]|uniref:dihydrofolate reductase n=1 Tax=Paenibacillus sp. CF384 TaxID=1884382 RepID=UPI00089AB192|nr:dihydrofolate reductase [Paenibacillus sp. CF384]SDX78000.1 dihydrofolate reductase [Paenibacillus sp. CF384]